MQCMPIAPHQLPDDVDALKSLLAEQAIRLDHFVVRNEQLKADKQAVEQKDEQLKVRVLTLTEQLNLALARRYAASSKSCHPIRSVCSMKRSWMANRDLARMPRR